MYAWLDLYAAYVAPWALLLALAALAWNVVLWRRLRQSEERYAELTEGVQGGNLEEVLTQHVGNVRKAVTKSSDAWETAMRVERGVRGHIQHTALTRYNPFSNTGSDQSFVLVLADADGNGVVVNSLHARDGTRIYAKPLATWNSTYTLTDEERQAIAKARGPKE